MAQLSGKTEITAGDSIRIKEVERHNRAPKKYAVSKKNFVCLEVEISTESNWYKSVFSEAKKIESKLNKGQANTSEERSEDIVEIDNLAGVIAEYACFAVLRYYFKDAVEKPSSDKPVNQIDIMFSGIKKTVEVRSSFVKNGIDFALFNRPNDKDKEQYFDVIGPYSNGYKPGEIIKDYYMRVLYEGKKEEFKDVIDQKKIRLYITGGVTADMIENKSISQVKHLKPKGGEVKLESDYIVVPMGESLEFPVFIENISRELLKK